ncbi:hypothetical protein DPX16_13631 [Anabarilius grahami]|uniref:Uncharacterized protein n=1 Tax=Anabarilius grahami TaxID=495550 RepID=A0A3N0XSF4_ANAGA|nr:hypothetical protein DPX16_13631 [Anabarilius grahami]
MDTTGASKEFSGVRFAKAPEANHRLTHLWVSQHHVYKLQQLNGESIDGLIHPKIDQTVFSEMSVIFGVVFYPELQAAFNIQPQAWPQPSSEFACLKLFVLACPDINTAGEL